MRSFRLLSLLFLLLTPVIAFAVEPAITFVQLPSKVSGVHKLQVQVSDTTPDANDTECGISRVQFFLDNAALGPAITVPANTIQVGAGGTVLVGVYSFDWDTRTIPDKSYTLSVSALDKSGGASAPAGSECDGKVPNEGQATATVEVDNITPDVTKPTVTIQNPKVADVLPRGKTNIQVVASDLSGIAKINLFVDGVLRLVGNETERIVFNWNTVPYRGDNVEIRAEAFDNAGNIGVHAIPVSVRR